MEGRASKFIQANIRRGAFPHRRGAGGNTSRFSPSNARSRRTLRVVRQTCCPITPSIAQTSPLGQPSSPIHLLPQNAIGLCVRMAAATRLTCSFPDCRQAVSEIQVDAVAPLSLGERRIARTAVISEPFCLPPPNDFFALCGSTFEHHLIGVRHLAVQKRQFDVLADETLNRRRGFRAIEARWIGFVHRLPNR